MFNFEDSVVKSLRDLTLEEFLREFFRLKEEEKKQELRKKKEKNGNPSRKNGGVAQLGEHLPCTQGVRGSNPLISTRGEGKNQRTTF